MYHEGHEYFEDNDVEYGRELKKVRFSPVYMDTDPMELVSQEFDSLSVRDPFEGLRDKRPPKRRNTMILPSSRRNPEIIPTGPPKDHLGDMAAGDIPIHMTFKEAMNVSLTNKELYNDDKYWVKFFMNNRTDIRPVWDAAFRHSKHRFI